MKPALPVRFEPNEWRIALLSQLSHLSALRPAVVKSYAQVSLELGKSPAKVREHYNDPKPEIEALRYFAVLPTEAVRNIVAIPRA